MRTVEGRWGRHDQEYAFPSLWTPVSLTLSSVEGSRVSLRDWHDLSLTSPSKSKTSWVDLKQSSNYYDRFTNARVSKIICFVVCLFCYYYFFLPSPSSSSSSSSSLSLLTFVSQFRSAQRKTRPCWFFSNHPGMLCVMLYSNRNLFIPYVSLGLCDTSGQGSLGYLYRASALTSPPSLFNFSLAKVLDTRINCLYLCVEHDLHTLPLYTTDGCPRTDEECPFAHATVAARSIAS